jgi:hypothetical protein
MAMLPLRDLAVMSMKPTSGACGEEVFVSTSRQHASADLLYSSSNNRRSVGIHDCVLGRRRRLFQLVNTNLLCTGVRENAARTLRLFRGSMRNQQVLASLH